MTIIDAIIQGVVQGLTEFLPVSSSGHLAITQHITGVAGESNLFFNVMLHVGTLVAVAAFYHKLFWSLIKEFFRMLRDIFTGKFKWREMNYERNLIVMLIIALLPLFIMFLPVPGTDMKVKDLADIFSGAQILLVTALSLLLTSILLAVGARCNKKNSTASFKHMKGSSAETKGRENYTVLDAVCVGLMQVAAALLEGKDAIKEGVQVEPLVILVGVVVAAVVGYLSILLFKWFLKTDKMILFIVYTALAGAALTVVSAVEIMQGANLFTGQPAALSLF